MAKKLSIHQVFSSDFENGTPFSRSPHPPKMTKLAQEFKVPLNCMQRILMFWILMFLIFNFQTMSVDSSESASASEGVYDDLEYLNLIFQVFYFAK